MELVPRCVSERPSVRCWLQTRRLKRMAPLLLGLAAVATTGWWWLGGAADARLLQRAIQSADRGHREAAIVLFDQVLKHRPSECTALLYRGQLALDSGDREAAARFWRRVPDHPAREGATARLMEGMWAIEARQT